MKDRIETKSQYNLILGNMIQNLTLKVYKEVGKLSDGELFCLTEEFIRAIVSTSSIITAAFNEDVAPEKLRLLNRAKKELVEIQIYIRLSVDLQFCEVSRLNRGVTEVSKLLTVYINTIKK